MVKLALFLAATAGITWLSRASLRKPGSHGFYRFLAWEAILALILLNAEHWFRRPFSAHQLVSWSLLIVSALLVVHGVHLLRALGKPSHQRPDEALMGLERTTTLVRTGAFKYIRHPMYSSLLFLAWGVFFKDPAWLPGILAFAASGFLVATAKAEEAENIRFFGPAYESYMRETRMFIPFLL